CPVVGGLLCPTRSCVCRLHRISDVLAVAFTDLAQQFSLRSAYLDAVTGIRPNLLPANIEFGGAVDVGCWVLGVGCWALGVGCWRNVFVGELGAFWSLGHWVVGRLAQVSILPLYPSPILPLSLYILPQPLTAALPSEPGLPVAAEAGSGIK